MPRPRPLAVAVLAGGEGRRMRSHLPKALHPVAGKAALLHVLDAAAALGPERTVVVVPPGAGAIAAALADAASPAETAVQDEPRGTAHAVEAACAALGGFAGDLLVLCADTPLLAAPTLARVRDRLAGGDAPGLAVLAFRASDPSGFGRLRAGGDGVVEAIVEERDAGPEERAGNLCNAGVLAAAPGTLPPLLARIGSDNAAGERYLTDAVALAAAAGVRCVAVEGPEEELVGVNTRAELARAEALMQERLRARAMEGGATLLDPASVWLAHDTEIGADARIGPQVFFGPGVAVGPGAEIAGFCHLEGARVAPGARVGPFARLRPGAVVEEGARVGNFVEVKNARIGAGAKVNHLAYVGDGEVGDGANVGAGTIFCNYDGRRKHRTEVGAGAFIGSNTALVAPVRVGRGAVVGAGSTITRDVDDDALAVARAPARLVPGGAKRRRPGG